MMSRTPRGRRSARRALLATLVVGTACLAPAAVASADETFTLDGQASTQAAILAAGAICGAGPNDAGVNECFSTEEAMATAQAAAVRAGELPAGWGVIPATPAEREALAQSFEDEGAGGSSAARASLLLGSCGWVNTHIYTDANQLGTHGTQGATGTNVWLNYSSTYNNKVSSFATSNDDTWDTRWHDLADGGGAYYGPIGSCVTNNNLAGTNMNDGVTANDRFSSFAGW
jgi:hypothetical protein